MRKDKSKLDKLIAEIIRLKKYCEKKSNGGLMDYEPVQIKMAKQLFEAVDEEGKNLGDSLVETEIWGRLRKVLYGNTKT